jgi:hypothetical protein
VEALGQDKEDGLGGNEDGGVVFGETYHVRSAEPSQKAVYINDPPIDLLISWVLRSDGTTPRVPSGAAELSNNPRRRPAATAKPSHPPPAGQAPPALSSGPSDTPYHYAHYSGGPRTHITTSIGITAEGHLTRDYAQVTRDPDATNYTQREFCRRRAAWHLGRGEEGVTRLPSNTLEVDKPCPPRSRILTGITRDQP